MAIRVEYASQLSVIDTLGGSYVSSSDATVTTNGMNTSETLTPSSTVPVSKYASYQVTLSSGSATIDLTSLPNANGEAAAVTGNGLKLNAYKFRNKSTNANNMTIGEGASNGYEVHGNAWTYVLRPGEEITFRGADSAPDIGSGAKTIDISGTGSQILEVTLIMG